MSAEGTGQASRGREGWPQAKQAGLLHVRYQRGKLAFGVGELAYFFEKPIPRNGKQTLVWQSTHALKAVAGSS